MYQARSAYHTLHLAFLLSHFKPPYNSNEVVIPFLSTEDTKTREVRQSKVTELGSDRSGLEPTLPDAKTCISQKITQLCLMPKSSPQHRLYISIQVKLK